MSVSSGQQADKNYSSEMQSHLLCAAVRVRQLVRERQQTEDALEVELALGE